MPSTELLVPASWSRRTETHFAWSSWQQKIPFECEKVVTVHYRDRPVALHRLDLVVRGCVVVELKAVKLLKRVHEAQVLAYLKASQLPVGLLMNFGGATLKEGFRRIIL